MSYAKPIWNKVTSCKYQGSKSFGAYNDCKVETYTGSSSKNSEKLCTVEIKKKVYDDFVIFNIYLDEQLMKQNIHAKNKKSGGAAEFIEQRTGSFINSNNVNTYKANLELV